MKSGRGSAVESSRLCWGWSLTNVTVLRLVAESDCSNHQSCSRSPSCYPNLLFSSSPSMLQYLNIPHVVARCNYLKFSLTMLCKSHICEPDNRNITCLSMPVIYFNKHFLEFRCFIMILRWLQILMGRWIMLQSTKLLFDIESLIQKFQKYSCTFITHYRVYGIFWGP